MVGLPNIGDRIRIYPRPGRRVLAAPFAMDAPILAHASYLPTSGQEVVWDYFRHEQLKSGDILLHAPPCDEHDHGTDGIDECRHCGRSLSDAQVYDVHVAHGAQAARDDATAAAAAREAAEKGAAEARKQEIVARQKAAAEAAAQAKAKLAPAPKTATPSAEDQAAASARAGQLESTPAATATDDDKHQG